MTERIPKFDFEFIFSNFRFKNGEPLVDRRFSVGTLGDLTLTFLSLNDAGEFVCRAENIYGTAETISIVEVLRRADAGNRESGSPWRASPRPPAATASRARPCARRAPGRGR